MRLVLGMSITVLPCRVFIPQPMRRFHSLLVLGFNMIAVQGMHALGLLVPLIVLLVYQ